MHSVNPTTEMMIRSVLAYAENRLRLDPVPLDGCPPDIEAMTAMLEGLIGDEPHNPDQVLGAYTSVMAPAVMSADSPRFLGFIPAAPTKAALLFDMLISCASIQGISGLPLWFSLSVYGVRAYTEAIETAIQLARDAAAEISRRSYLELVREPSLGIVLFRRPGWAPADYTAWADQLLRDQVAFLPPSAWEGETVARFAFLHPHTSSDLVRQILDRMK